MNELIADLMLLMQPLNGYWIYRDYIEIYTRAETESDPSLYADLTERLLYFFPHTLLEKSEEDAILAKVAEIVSGASKGNISGKVSDSISAAAIVGATVILTQNAAPVPGFPNITTDASGNYSFTALDPAIYNVAITATNYTGANQNSTVTAGQTTTTNFSLVKITGTINGNVKDSVSSANLSGVTVALQTTAGAAVPGFSNVTTAANGNFSWTGVPLGDYRVSMTRAADYTAKNSANFTIANATPVVRNETLVPIRGSVTGTVTDAGGNVEGVTVTLLTTADATIAENPSVTTAANGTFTIPNVRVGSYKIKFEKATYTTLTKTQFSTTAGSPNSTQDATIVLA